MGQVPIAGETKDEKVVPDGDGGSSGFGAYRDDGAHGAGGDHGVRGSEVSAITE